MTQFPPWIDISVTLHPGLVAWPGDPSFAISRVAELAAGDEANVSALSFCAHTGTHLDAPSHFLPDAAGIESFSCAVANGPAQVVEVGDIVQIGADILKGKLAPECRRLLFKTRNSVFWDEGKFRYDYTFLTSDGADWLIREGVRLVGIDYLSIGSPRPEQDVHATLLAAGVWILEGLDLRNAPPGIYDLICLPLRIGACEAAPARAFLAPPGTLRLEEG
ncbi:MAG: cyclase family protein [Desulfuromonadaceae bacterium]|nr:cyclase family protein [Desulfuromonadaceae bacterium]